MRWGQTGTRAGGTSLQLASVSWLWATHEITELHDGDCIGADAQLYYLARVFGVTSLVIHPPVNSSNRAWCGVKSGDDQLATKILTAKPYFDRNRDVVDASEVMVVVPKESTEQHHGGTWYTVNYARSVKKPLAIVWPNGHITYENWTF